MMSDLKVTGVDAQFVEGRIAPFAGCKFVEEQDLFEKESSKPLVKGPKRPKGLGPEKGRLDRLYEEYKNEELGSDTQRQKLELLLEDVERYARRITLGKGGKLSRWLAQSPTNQYPQTELSQAATIKVWRGLVEDKFKGKSKFSVWVHRIVRNVMHDILHEAVNRHEVELLDWKGYQRSQLYTEPITYGSRGTSGKSANAEFEVKGGSKVPLVDIYTKDSEGIREENIEKLHSLIEEHLDGVEYVIAQLLLDWYRPSGIAKVFGKKPKWATNKIAQIKKKLRRLSKKDGSAVLVLERGKKKALPAVSAAAD